LGKREEFENRDEDDDDRNRRALRPRPLQVLPLNCPNQIVKVTCGGMHTVALASDGSVYTWGCNDDGALGRLGTECLPLKVDSALNIPMTDISAGDSHTIVYNREKNKVFYWGCYRVSKGTFTLLFSIF
jgi:regulator of chromosome condensation